jgi:hypothetical protein
MGLDRKDLPGFMEGNPTKPFNPDKAKLDLVEGSAILAMTQSPGWAVLRKKFIDPHTSVDRLLAAKPETLLEERAKLVELQNLLSFIERAINDAQKASKDIKEAQKA